MLIAIVVVVAVLVTPAPRRASITLAPKALSGHRVEVPVVIDTAGQTINAAQVFLVFNPAEVQVTSVSKTGSLFKLWVKDEPAFSNATGQISFAGGVFTPGFTGRGQIGTVTLEAKHPLTTRLTFSSQTSALLNDGKGTAISLNLQPVEVKIP